MRICEVRTNPSKVELAVGAQETVSFGRLLLFLMVAEVLLSGGSIERDVHADRTVVEVTEREIESSTNLTLMKPIDDSRSKMKYRLSFTY